MLLKDGIFCTSLPGVCFFHNQKKKNSRTSRHTSKHPEGVNLVCFFSRCHSLGFCFCFDPAFTLAPIIKNKTRHKIFFLSSKRCSLARIPQVYLTSAAPPVRCPNVYGIDIPTKTELVAYNRTPEEVNRNTKVYLVPGCK